MQWAKYTSATHNSMSVISLFWSKKVQFRVAFTVASIIYESTFLWGNYNVLKQSIYLANKDMKATL